MVHIAEKAFALEKKVDADIALSFLMSFPVNGKI